MNDFIKLHPKNYKEVSDKVIFYIKKFKFYLEKKEFFFLKCSESPHSP